MSLSFLTCQDLPELCEDDSLLIDELKKQKIDFKIIPWNTKEAQTNPMVIRTPWDYQMDSQGFFDYLNEHEKSGQVLLNPLEVVRWNISKEYLVELQHKKAPVVPTLLFQKGNNVPAIREFHELPWEKLVIKPEIGASGFETIVCHRDEVGKYGDIINSIYSRCGIIVQPFCEEITSFGEVSYIYYKEKSGNPFFSHCLLKKAKKGEFRIQDDHGGTVHPIDKSSDFLECAEKCLDLIPFENWLYARVDMLYYKGKAVVGEIEMIEPELFFRMNKDGAQNFIQALKSYLD